MAKLDGFFKLLLHGNPLYTFINSFGKIRNAINGVMNFGSNVLDSVSSSSDGNILNNAMNKYLGTGLTGAEREANEWTAQREDTQAQRAVVDYKAAGLNPALMFANSGSTGSYASGSTSPQSGSFQDLITMLSLPLQLKQMQANIKKTEVDIDSEKLRQKEKLQIVENLKATYNEILSRTDLNDTQQQNLLAAGSWIDRIQEATYNSINAKTNLDNKTANRIDKLLEGELNIQMKTLQDFDKVWEKIDAEIKKLAAETNLLERDLQDYALNHMVSGLGGTGANVINILRAYFESVKDKDGDGKPD